MKTLPLLLAGAAFTCGATGLAQNADPKKPTAAAPAFAEVRVPEITPADAEKLLQEKKKDLVVLDIRTPEEFEKGHIPGARNIDFLADDFARRLSEVEGKQIILHCASGNRSAKALPILTEKHRGNIYHLSGGYKAWVDAGKPVVK